jgi:hypothetical protein
MRKTLFLTLLIASSAAADEITGTQGFEYRAYRSSEVPHDIADLKVGTSSQLSCDALGFTTDLDAAFDNIKNIVDNIMSNKQVLLLGAAQYLLAKASPTLYSVLSRLNHLTELAMKYNFDACALYKKAQQEASKAAGQGRGLSGLCMSILGDPETCAAPGKALQAVFGKERVDVVDEAIKNKEVADLVKAITGTVVLEVNGDGMSTTYYDSAWHIADIYNSFYQVYYNKYAEIAEKVHYDELKEDDYYDKYAPWITIGGNIAPRDLEKVKISETDGMVVIDLSEAKMGGFQIPYKFFIEVSAFQPSTAAIYIDKLARYAAIIDLQAFLNAVEQALADGAEKSGKAGVLQNEALIEKVKSQYRQFASTFGEAGKENIVQLIASAKERHETLKEISSSTEVEKQLTDILKGPTPPSESSE